MGQLFVTGGGGKSEETQKKKKELVKNQGGKTPTALGGGLKEEVRET